MENSDKEFTIRLDDSTLRLVRVPYGEFMMGSALDEPESRGNERPKHRVRVPSFFLGAVTVSQLQWKSVMKKLPSIDPEFVGDDLPVVNVWLESALEFCRRLSADVGIPIRLPSEAEWEFACRAGTQTAFFWGDTISRQQVNYEARERTANAGLKPAGFSGIANAFGLYDMHGNVWEWCADVWHDDYINAPDDGSAWTSAGDAGYHVQRGGSWADTSVVCRSAFRVGDVARNSDNIVGLRVCATIS